MARLNEHQRDELTELMLNYAEASEYADFPTEYIDNVVCPKIEEWLTEPPGTMSQTIQWGVLWDDGKVSIADSEYEARNVSRIWSVVRRVVRRTITTYTEEWQRVE